MIEWVMIFALYYNAPSVIWIPGFMSETECKKAGDKAVKELKEYTRAADYVCFQRGAV